MNVNPPLLSSNGCFLMYCNLLDPPIWKKDFMSIMNLGSFVGERCEDKNQKYSLSS